MASNLAEMKQRNQQQQPGTELARKEKTIFDFLSGDTKIEKAIAAVAGQHFTPDRFLRLAVNSVKKTPLLMQCDTQSVLGAFMTAAALGLEPNTVLQQAFLIPYKKRKLIDGKWDDAYECNFQIGARGFVTLAHRSPEIATLQSEAIHECDLFEHMLGTESFLKYKKRLKDRGGLVGSFCFTKMADGYEMATVLPYDEIIKIRGRSETFSALSRVLAEASSEKEIATAKKKFDETPWVMWEDDMASKSATKKHAKQLPLSQGDAMSVAAQLDGDDGRTIDMASMTDPDRVRAVMKDGVDAADVGASGSNEAYGLRPNAALPDDASPIVTPIATRRQQAQTVEPIDAEEVLAHQKATPTASNDGYEETPPPPPPVRPQRRGMTID